MPIEKKIQKSVWVAEDGKEFDTKKDCQNYEKEIDRIKKLSVYNFQSDFDGTEGRGYYYTNYLVTDFCYESILHFCFDEFGMPIHSWYPNTCNDRYAEWITPKLARMTVQSLSKDLFEHKKRNTNFNQPRLILLGDFNTDYFKDFNIYLHKKDINLR